MYDNTFVFIQLAYMGGVVSIASMFHTPKNTINVIEHVSASSFLYRKVSTTASLQAILDVQQIQFVHCFQIHHY